MSDKKFLVSGGEYTNTTFKEVIPKTMEVHGPYDTHEEALVKWNERARATLDFCNYRFYITEQETKK